MEVMPYVSGTLLYIGVEKGKGVPVNGIMAIIGKPGEDISSLIGANASVAPQIQSTAASPAVAVGTPQPAVVAESIPLATDGDERVKASPLARKMAEEKGIDMHRVHGSGDGGRIIKRDLDGFVPAKATTAAAPAAQPVASFSNASDYTDTPLSQMRRIIAQRLAESKFSAPHFYLRITVSMDNAIIARKAINDFTKSKVSFNDLIIKACAVALKKHPVVNSSWMGDFIRQNHQINIGTAVAVEEGLIVPVVKNADQKSLTAIAEETTLLIDKARTKKIQPQEFTGNTFTISNLGMMDIDEFTAIINPPDSCILAVGKISPTPTVENGVVVIKQLLKLTLSCDHRVVDGATGAAFLQTLKAHLENPVTMLA